jgi:hypothetical protein
MSTDPLQVLSVDYLASHWLVLYFSDGTYATMSAQELAEYIPDRKRTIDTERGGRNQKPDTNPDPIADTDAQAIPPTLSIAARDA